MHPGGPEQQEQQEQQEEPTGAGGNSDGRAAADGGGLLIGFTAMGLLAWACGWWLAWAVYVGDEFGTGWP